jgi:hypothetical protein
MDWTPPLHQQHQQHPFVGILLSEAIITFLFISEKFAAGGGGS